MIFTTTEFTRLNNNNDNVKHGNKSFEKKIQDTTSLDAVKVSAIVVSQS